MKIDPELYEVIAWFSVRGLKPISHFDVCHWRPELLDAFISMVRAGILTESHEPKHEYALDSKGRVLVSELKAGRLQQNNVE